MELKEKRCVPCEGGAKPLEGSELRRFLEEYGSELDGWDITEGKLMREFSFKDFSGALEFVNKVGEIAEKENHHPDICFGWGKVNLSLVTHAIGGLSENDFILAAKISGLS
jgi:4a-hydroxytetrahydrobiopterin dehydratase